jgi:DMSO/TMAO reductase YedYZ molybdopterin-dependent catalytic subunit
MLTGTRWQTGAVRERDLLVLTDEPFNAEARLDQRRGTITPAGRHYVRTHFPIPEAAAEIVIEDQSPRSISLGRIQGLPARTVLVTLECAGNGRRFLEPKVPGEQWGCGAVGTAEWTGASLHAVLESASVRPTIVEVLFRGADEGVPKDLGRRIAYERSLPIDVALREDVIVAYAMNGEPIPREHGGPLRLIVPGWYGMASVKWLERITLLDRPFVGFYQTDRYVIDGIPLREIAPRAVITSPDDGDDSSSGHVEIRGYAWSGRAPIERVDLSLDGASPLGSMRLHDPGVAYAWREFAFVVSIDPGEHTLMARATDAAGNTQPLEPRWNELGYMNNAMRPVRIRVRG